MMISRFHKNRRLRLAVPAAILLSAAAATAAAAQTGPLVIGGARQSSSPVPMTRAELRDCMRRNDDLERQTSDLKARVDQVHAEDAALRDTAQKLDEIKKRLADTSDGLIEDYNQLAFDYNLRAGALGGKRMDLQRDIDQAEANRQAFNASCANRPVLKADQAAVMRERAQAQAAASAPGH